MTKRKKHPTDLAYSAGAAYAKKHPGASYEDVKAQSRGYEDDDAFMDGWRDNTEWVELA